MKLVCYKILPVTNYKPWRIKLRFEDRDAVFNISGYGHVDKFLTERFGPLKSPEIEMSGGWRAGIREVPAPVNIGHDCREPFLGGETSAD